MVGKAVAHVAQAALLDVLLDGIERLLLGDLHLGVGPAGDLDDHVEDAIALIGEKRDVMERGEDLAVLFDVDAMFWRFDHYVVTGSQFWKQAYRGCLEHR